MIVLKEITKEKEQVLYNLLQKYLYELSQFYDDLTVDEEGKIEYKYFPLYFSEKDRDAYFIYDDDAMVGFALVNARSETDEKIDRHIAELAIFPPYRKGGRGIAAVGALTKMHSGIWQLKYSTRNPVAAKFWQKVKALYGGWETKLAGSEIAITFKAPAENKIGREQHNIDPVYDKESKVLILGSFPSVKSREAKFFYAHPQNRFWKVTAAVFGEDVPQTEAEKRAFLLRNHIAVWDVIKSCDIKGSSDLSIENVEPNNLNVILEAAPIEKIFVNGGTAEKYYKRYIKNSIGKDAERLPSTSPANAAWRIDRLIEAWRIIKW